MKDPRGPPDPGTKGKREGVTGLVPAFYWDREGLSDATTENITEERLSRALVPPQMPESMTFSAREYRSELGGNGGSSLYETARLLPYGDDGGFAERFLKDRRSARDT